MSNYSDICYKYLPPTSETLHIGRERTNSRRGNHARGPACDELVCYQCTTALQSSSETRQCWFADDATGSGSLEDIKKWWNALLKHGPDLGYFPNAMKCWLITKPDKEVATRILFDGTAINVTARGHRHLDAALRSREYLEEYVSQKVEAWVVQVFQLAEFAKSQPQASYAAYIFGLRHTWTYFQRTLPDVDELLEPLERAFADSLEGCPILSTSFYRKK